MNDPRQSPHFKPRRFGNRYMCGASGRPVEHVGRIKTPGNSAREYVFLDLLTDQWIVTDDPEEMDSITEMEVLALVAK